MTSQDKTKPKKERQPKPENKPQKEAEKKEKKPLFEYPQDWKEQIKATFTVNT